MTRDQDNIVSVHDVASAIMSYYSYNITTMRLQKLVYYCQAWSLVWDEQLLYDEKIEAWANGPIVPKLYKNHRGIFLLDEWPNGNPKKLSTKQKDSVRAVFKFYGGKSGHWLSQLTHKESPWINARKGLAPGERGNKEITPAAMAEYYGSL